MPRNPHPTRPSTLPSTPPATPPSTPPATPPATPPSPPTHILRPNLGAEEGDEWPRRAGLPAVAATAMLWRHLFPAAHELAAGLPEAAEAWPDCLGERPRRAAFEWLEAPGLHCWLADGAARTAGEEAAGAGPAPDPDVVEAVHDKAFALRGAETLDLTPACLDGLLHAYSPEALRRPEPFLADLEQRLGAWPDWPRGRFTLKPRMGSSGRGRVGGRADALDRPRLRASLGRLAERGGAILEPWLERHGDLSVVLHIAPTRTSGPPITILGGLESLVTPAGVYLGHAGEIDPRGRVFATGPEQELLREAAVALAGHARERGFWGPCGLDSLLFRGPENEVAKSASGFVLRPVVEFNARFTVGVIVVGLIRRILAGRPDALAVEPGERLGFFFALDTPSPWPSWEALARSLGEAERLFPLAPPSAAARPALLFSNQIPKLRESLAR